jgi:3-hydroxyacyl-CoA dehydrogenase
MGCHYRIAQRGAKLGLPEVKLGLLPGGGGTQRLPRLAGVEAAVRMITEGEPATADDALAMGLVDEVTEGELLPAAIAFAEGVAQRSDHPVASQRQAAPPSDPRYFETSARRSRPRSAACPRRRSASRAWKRLSPCRSRMA